MFKAQIYSRMNSAAQSLLCSPAFWRQERCKQRTQRVKSSVVRSVYALSYPVLRSEVIAIVTETQHKVVNNIVLNNHNQRFGD